MLGDAQLTIWIPAMATIAAASVAGIAGYVTSSLRVRELRLTYEQRLRDSYLENARKVSADVYIPLSQAIWALRNAYENLRIHIDSKSELTPVGAKNHFKGAARKFEDVLQDIMGRGGSAYVTLSLEDELNTFRSFLSKSLDAEKSTILISFTPTFYGFSSTYDLYPKTSSILLLSRMASKSFFPGISLKTEDVLLAAMIGSRDFERRFTELTLVLSALIKEVTLGSKVTPS